MNLYHPQLTQSRWNEFSKDRQVLLIASEIARASAWIDKQGVEEVRQSYLRALELLDMAKADANWGRGGRELSRYREHIGNLLTNAMMDKGQCLMAYRFLLDMTAKTHPIPTQ